MTGARVYCGLCDRRGSATHRTTREHVRRTSRSAASMRASRRADKPRASWQLADRRLDDPWADLSLEAQIDLASLCRTEPYAVVR